MDFFWHIIATICIALPNILGFNLVFGKGKIFHFGPMGVSIIAAYGTFVPLINGFSYPLALVIGLVLTLLVSLLFAWISLRLPPDAFGVMSIAAHLAILAIVLNWNDLTHGALGIAGIPRFSFLHSTMDFALFSFVLAAFYAGFLAWLNRLSFGRKLDALAEHQWYAAALGVNRTMLHITVFLIAGVGALMTGVLSSQYIFLLHPSDLGFPAFIFLTMIVVAGKPGSVPGVVLSTILLILLREGLRFVPIDSTILGPLRLILFGMILCVAVWVRRDTLFPKQRSV